MQRPYLVHFMAIRSEDSIAIRSSINLKENELAEKKEIELKTPTNPIQNIRLLNSHEFLIKICGLDKDHKEIYNKVFDSDGLGNFNFKIPLTSETEDIQVIQVYELKTYPGLEINLGTFIPQKIDAQKKIIICDFDKTLVDTRYSTTRDVFNSLTRPLEYFPTLNNSMEILRKHIDRNFHPFILSASPHFYEEAIRDWLYQNSIYTAGIFLKDYRQIFSFSEGHLTAKDIKIQGLYKLNHLLDILHMTGVPEEIVLMGDNYESDPIIYLTLATILVDKVDPWSLWNTVRSLESFQLTNKQNSQFLNKIYQLSSSLNKFRLNHPGQSPKVKIYIRKKGDESQIDVSSFFSKQMELIELYHGVSK